MEVVILFLVLGYICSKVFGGMKPKPYLWEVQDRAGMTHYHGSDERYIP